MSSNNVFEIRSLLQGSQSILIALGTLTDEDVVAAGLALYLMLVKLRKETVIVASDQTKVDMAHLFGVDKITDKMAGGSSLVVSMPYEEGTIEKVSYNIENGRLNVVIDPRGEQLKFNQEQVEFNYGRGDYDMIFVLGAPNIAALGKLYQNHKNIFSQKPIVNIDKSSNNTSFGRINLVENAPVSLLVAQMVKNLRLPIEQDPASNLYTGIIGTYGSKTLDTVQPDVLDTIAFLRRTNAQNLKQSGNTSPVQEEQNAEPAQRPVMQPTQQAEQKNIQEFNINKTVQNTGAEGDEAPEDWLKPKIFTTQKN